MAFTQEQNRIYQREWKAARRRAFFEGKSCAWCGSTDSLELDHVDPKLKVSHKIWSWAENRRKAELEKCQILCHQCHVSKSWSDGSHRTTVHGTVSMYDIYSCRCAPCKAAKAVKTAAYRERKRKQLSLSGVTVATQR